MKKLDSFPTRVILQCLLFLSLSLFSFSQGRTVTGKVIDAETKNPMSAVTVSVKGTKTATQTNTDGTYSITVPEGAKSLVFSFVGYGDQEVALGSAASVNVTLTLGG